MRKFKVRRSVKGLKIQIKQVQEQRNDVLNLIAKFEHTIVDSRQKPHVLIKLEESSLWLQNLQSDIEHELAKFIKKVAKRKQERKDAKST